MRTVSVSKWEHLIVSESLERSSSFRHSLYEHPQLKVKLDNDRLWRELPPECLPEI